jgi:hypothetical protein
MDLPVLVEALANGAYRARLRQPLELTAEAATRAQALADLRLLLEEQLRQGKEIASIQVPNGQPPWLAAAGIFRADDPVVQEWVKAMQDYRDEAERDPNYL